MGKILGLFLLPFQISLLSQPINIISYNIRYDNPGDGVNAWPKRVEMVNGLLRFHEADLFGLQEALYSQIQDIHNEHRDHEWIGVGREDGKKGGEFSPIFYNKSKFIVHDHGTFWLSETPRKPGKGWDAANTRIATWGHFQSKMTGKQFWIINTHFDHRGKEAQKNSATLILDKIKEITRNEGLPVILMGDFNLAPEQEPIVLIKQHMEDSYDISQDTPYGPRGTFNGFKMDADLNKNRIDYIFIQGAVDVLKYAVITDFKDGRFPSDHFPVFASILLK